MKASGLFCVILAVGAVGLGSQALAGYGMPRVPGGHGGYHGPMPHPGNAPRPGNAPHWAYEPYQHSQYGSADRAQWPRANRYDQGAGLDLGGVIVTAPSEDAQAQADAGPRPYAIPVAVPVFVAAEPAPVVASSGPRIIYVNAASIAKETGAQPQIIYGRPPLSHGAMPTIIYGDTAR